MFGEYTTIVGLLVSFAGTSFMILASGTVKSVIIRGRPVLVLKSPFFFFAGLIFLAVGFLFQASAELQKL